MRSCFLLFAPLVHVSLVKCFFALCSDQKLIVLVVSNDTFISSVICSLFGAIQVSIIPNLVTTFINPCSFSLQFADDTTAVLADTDSAVKLFEILNSFEIITGLKINCSKTEGTWIGSLRNHKAKAFGILTGLVSQ